MLTEGAKGLYKENIKNAVEFSKASCSSQMKQEFDFVSNYFKFPKGK